MPEQTDSVAKAKPFESRWGKIALVVIGVFVGAFLGEPVKNFVNRARVEIDVVSIASTTPPKSRWLMNLSPSAQQNLSAEIAGNDWRNSALSNRLSYGELDGRYTKLKQFHDSFPVLSEDAAWAADSQKTDLLAFYETNRDYIRTILDYTQELSELSPTERARATNLLKQDQRALSMLAGFSEILGGSRQGPPRNAPDMVRLAGQYQSRVQEATKQLLEALKMAIVNEAVIEPIPSFKVTVDATNYGGRSISIGSLGSLRVQSPASTPSETIVILELEDDALSPKDDPKMVGVLAPGQRQRFVLTAEIGTMSDQNAISNASPDFVRRLSKIRDTQVNALKVLGPLYKSGVSNCRVILGWGESQNAEASGVFGEAQALEELERVLRSPE